jgi:hypothetical protein
MKVLIFLGIILLAYAGPPNCGNGNLDQAVLELDSDYVTSLDFAMMLADSPAECRRKLICEYPCSTCPAEPFLYDVTSVAELKLAYGRQCTRPKQNSFTQVIRERMAVLELNVDRSAMALFNETETQLYIFAKSISRLCDQRMIPRTTPVQVINDRI